MIKPHENLAREYSTGHCTSVESVHIILICFLTLSIPGGSVSADQGDNYQCLETCQKFLVALCVIRPAHDAFLIVEE